MCYRKKKAKNYKEGQLRYSRIERSQYWKRPIRMWVANNRDKDTTKTTKIYWMVLKIPTLLFSNLEKALC